MRSAKALLSGMIDYAGLFPPAGLGMDETIRNFAGYLAGPYAWILGRLVVPVSRLDEFAACLREIRPAGEFHVSALASEDPAGTVDAMKRFNERWQGRASIVSLETKLSRAEDLQPWSNVTPAGLDVYFEVPLDAPVEMLVEALYQAGGRAKVRTGGLTPSMFPGSVELMRFMAAANARRVAYKATAGLHHPIRGMAAVDSTPGAAKAVMHGFLNVLIAAAALYAGASPQDAVYILEETNPFAFVFDDDGVTWHHVTVTTGQIKACRWERAISFGSCSFEEPVGDARALGLIG